MFIYPGNCYSVLQLYTYLPAGRDGRALPWFRVPELLAFWECRNTNFTQERQTRKNGNANRNAKAESMNAGTRDAEAFRNVRPSLPTNRYYLGTNRKPWNKNHRLLIVCIRWLGEHLITPLFPYVGPQIFLRGQQIKNAQGTGMGLLNYV